MTTHSFSNTQVEIPGWHAAALRKMGMRIADADLNAEAGGGNGGGSSSTGRESEAHITVKYGLSDEKPTAELKRALSGFGPVTAKFGKTSLFKNEDADVVKIDIDSPDLRRLNALVAKTVETPGNTHPTYIPHATIAYVKPGKGEKYANDGTLNGQTVTFHEVVFSGKNGERQVIPLTAPKFKRYRMESAPTVQ